MKIKFLSYFAIAATLWVACDPIEDRDSVSGNVAVSDLDLTISPIVVNGLNSNEFIVENNSPILSRWISDRSQIQSAYCTVVASLVGTRNIQFIGLNGDGSYVEKNTSVEVDTMTNLSSDVKSRLGIEYDANGNPVETSLPYYWGVADYDYANSITVTQQVVGGVKGNLLTVECDAPYLCDWKFGTAKATKNSCDIFVTTTGTFVLSLDLTKADGTVIPNVYSQSYVVDELTYIPTELINLFGDFVTNPAISKTWQWARSGKVWANGPLRGFTDPGSGWWQNAYTDMTSRQDGTMTFKFSDLSLTKVVTGGDAAINPVGTYSGNVEVDLGTMTTGYSVGTLNLSGVTILYGVDVNAGNAAFTKVSLVKASSKTLILGGDSDGTGQTWLYKFESVGN